MFTYEMQRIVPDEDLFSPWSEGILRRNNVTVRGPEEAPVLLLVHGFGCDQNMFGRILPYLVDRFRVVLFDHVGSGGSDFDAFDPVVYATFDRYAADLLEVCEALELQDVTVIGHSVGATMAIAAAVARPELFSRLVLIAPSPSYIDDDESGYVGGFSQGDIDELLASLDDNHLAWAVAMAPVVMGAPDAPALSVELEQSFCRLDPRVMRSFARVAFLSDVRDLLPAVTTPTVILQCSVDALAPLAVGRYLHDRLPQSTLVHLSATGHVPQASAPEETARAILEHLGRRG
jgi:sigma-B regulation protein RsbQ